MAFSVSTALQHRSLTLSQINSRLAAAGVAEVDEAQLLVGVQSGWLLGQPDALYQVNPLYIIWIEPFLKKELD